MSAVPASPSSPDSRSRALDTSSTDSPLRSSSHRSSPGSTEPERVPMTRPSSGVKPMVVSTDRPRWTAAIDAPAPRWQETMRRSSSCFPRDGPHGARRRRAIGRGSRSGAGSSARATPWGARRWPRRPGAWRGRRCRSRPRPAPREEPPRRRRASRGPGTGAAAPGRRAPGARPRPRDRSGWGRGSACRRGRCDARSPRPPPARRPPPSRRRGPPGPPPRQARARPAWPPPCRRGRA